MVTRKTADIRLIRENCFIGYKKKDDQKCIDSFNVATYPHKHIWDETISFLKGQGFRVFQQPQFKKGGDYDSLGDKHISGSKNRLFFDSEVYPAGFRLEFYQNINRDNKNGGQYDFDKYKKMPKKQRTLFNLTVKKLIAHLVEKFDLKFYDQSNLQFPPLTAEQLILKHLSENCWDDRVFTSMDEIEGTMSDYDHNQNSTSGVKDTLKCGEVRYFEDYQHNIRKGKVYHYINNMWWEV